MRTEPAIDTVDGGLSRLRLLIAYDGTDFSGWARQPSLRTVCGVLEEKLSTILRTPVVLTVAGRTDAGVHASAQIAHCDVPVTSLASRSIDGDPSRLVRRMARMLPADVRVLAIDEVSADFDARFSALRRHYEYRLTDAEYGAMPLAARNTAEWSRGLNVDALNAASSSLLGLHDFAAFCRRRDGATTVRELQRFSWYRGDDGVLISQVSADAFCWSMVRSLVGAVASVGDGRRGLEWCRGLLDESQRSSDVPVAAACGLTLVRVDYPEEKDWAVRASITRDTRPPMPGCC